MRNCTAASANVYQGALVLGWNNRLTRSCSRYDGASLRPRRYRLRGGLGGFFTTENLLREIAIPIVLTWSALAWQNVSSTGEPMTGVFCGHTRRLKKSLAGPFLLLSAAAVFRHRARLGERGTEQEDLCGIVNPQKHARECTSRAIAGN
jgi:hypothetical protein